MIILPFFFLSGRFPRQSFQSKLSFGSKEIVAISCSWCKAAYHNKESCFNLDRLKEPCSLGESPRRVGNLFGMCGGRNFLPRAEMLPFLGGQRLPSSGLLASSSIVAFSWRKIDRTGGERDLK